MHFINFNPEWIGYMAAILTTLAYVPQAQKVFREKQTKAISLGMYIMISGGIFLWLVYGLVIGSPSLVLANGITLVLALGILWMKIKHG